MKKRSLSLVLALLIVLSSFGAVFAQTFTDVSTKHWAVDAIEYLYEAGVVSGHGGSGEGTFTPDANITRAQFATMINKALELTEEAEVDFTDVSESKWYYEEVAKAVAAGYVEGHGGSGQGTFTPGSPITREQAAIMVVKAFDLEESDEDADFSDADKISDWALDYVNTAAANEVIEGYPESDFKPQNNLKRSEAAKIIMNIFDIAIKEFEDAAKNLVELDDGNNIKVAELSYEDYEITVKVLDPDYLEISGTGIFAKLNEIGIKEVRIEDNDEWIEVLPENLNELIEAADVETGETSLTIIFDARIQSEGQASFIEEIKVTFDIQVI